MLSSAPASVFGAYARYYDLLYRDKDYAAEAVYVDGCLRAHRAPGSLLELGCGTGRHAEELMKLGYQVSGVDRSADMLASARARLGTSLGPARFVQGDVRSVRLDARFDAVVSLFHVVSYQVRDVDVHATFQTARAHLVEGGLFLFDCWYGPAVLTDPPAVRVKRMADGQTEVTRIAQPTVDTTESTVEVRYDVFVRDRASGQISELTESHLMRYLFVPELRRLLSDVGLKPLAFVEWMTDRAPSASTWNLCVLSRAE